MYRIIEEQVDRLILQNDLCKLCEWSKIWHLKFNIDKCKRINIENKEKISQNYFFISEDGEMINLQEVAQKEGLQSGYKKRF